MEEDRLLIRKGILVAAATASLAVAAATPLRALEAPAPSSPTEAVRTSVPAERRVPAPVAVPASPKPSESRAAIRAEQSVKPVARKPQRTPEAPHSAAPAPSPSRAPAAPQRTAQPTVITIGGYRVCDVDPQPCIDGGSLTLYGRAYGPGILAAHNYDGFQWLSRLPVGRTVVVASGPAAGTYEVTGHMRLNRQSGALPSFGSADLVLQSCEGSGTGFSLLRLIPS